MLKIKTILFASILFIPLSACSTNSKPTFTVTWKNWNDTILETDLNVKEGSTPSYDGKTPTRDSDTQFTYTFEKWTPDLSIVVSDVTYKAVFKSTLVKAKVTFNLNGGSSNSYVPYKYMDSIVASNFFFDVTKENYDFKGWSYNSEKVFDEKGNKTSNPALAETMEFTALFDKKTETTIKIGSYPQTKVSDNETIQQLNALAGTLPTSKNPQNWTAYNWYISNSKDIKFGWYIDLDTNSDGQNDYRGVYFTSYRPKSTASDSVPSKSYQDDNGYIYGSTYWFKFETIEWRILNNNSGDYFLMANKILDSEQFSMYTSSSATTKTDYQGNTASAYPNNYQYSDLRNFLNVDFYNTAFSSSEASRIQVTTVDNSASSTCYTPNSYACGNTSDKIFAPSYSEVTNSKYGFSSSASTKDSAKQLKVTDYAACLGCYIDSDYSGCGHFWLRSPRYGDPYYASYVYCSGTSDPYDYVNYTSFGVVPFMHIK